MSSASITTITRIVESLPEAAQHEVVEHLRRYVQELREQIRVTLLHELGHHHGLDEDDLEALGYG